MVSQMFTLPDSLSLGCVCPLSVDRRKPVFCVPGEGLSLGMIAQRDGLSHGLDNGAGGPPRLHGWFHSTTRSGDKQRWRPLSTPGALSCSQLSADPTDR